MTIYELHEEGIINVSLTVSEPSLRQGVCAFQFYNYISAILVPTQLFKLLFETRFFGSRNGDLIILHTQCYSYKDLSHNCLYHFYNQKNDIMA